MSPSALNVNFFRPNPSLYPTQFSPELVVSKSDPETSSTHKKTCSLLISYGLPCVFFSTDFVRKLCKMTMN